MIPITDASVSAHTVPTDGTESDGTLEWASTTIVEYFHDQARIGRAFFDGALEPIDGMQRPDLSRPGTGFEIKRAAVRRYVT